MISAQEARTRITTQKQQAVDDQFTRVISGIETAIKNNKTNFTVYGNLLQEVRNKLLNHDYKISELKQMGANEENYFIVSFE